MSLGRIFLLYERRLSFGRIFWLIVVMQLLFSKVALYGIIGFLEVFFLVVQVLVFSLLLYNMDKNLFLFLAPGHNGDTLFVVVVQLLNEGSIKCEKNMCYVDGFGIC